MAADAVALDRLASFRRGALPRLRIHPIQKDRFSILLTAGLTVLDLRLQTYFTDTN